MAGRGGKTNEPKPAPARVEDGELFAFKTDALSGPIPPLKITKPRTKADKPHYHDHRARLRERHLHHRGVSARLRRLQWIDRRWLRGRAARVSDALRPLQLAVWPATDVHLRAMLPAAAARPVPDDLRDVSGLQRRAPVHLQQRSDDAGAGEPAAAGVGPGCDCRTSQDEIRLTLSRGGAALWRRTAAPLPKHLLF